MRSKSTLHFVLPLHTASCTGLLPGTPALAPSNVLQRHHLPLRWTNSSARVPSILKLRCKLNQSSKKDLSSLRLALVDACTGLNRGLDFDPDAQVETEEEASVEDLAESLEDLNACTAPTQSENLNGSWDLLYTSSTLARYTGGLSGLHKYVDGKVGRITQYIDADDGTCTFSEQISYSLPVVNRASSVTVVIFGRIRDIDETRQIWYPETIKAAWLRLWAENWKSLRAFTSSHTTYLDKYIRITRGQTGSLSIFGRTQETEDSENE